MKISDCHLGFIGFGHMAQVLCRAIEQAKLIPRHQICFIRRDPEKARKSEQDFGITATSLKNLVQKSDLVVLAVRPNQAAPILAELGRLGPKRVVSVMAGIRLERYQKYLEKGVPLVRAMPNIASAVGEGMTLFSYGAGASNEFKSLTNLLFSCMGEIVEIPEDLMDIGTAMAGCGPGFVFRLIEAMARTGEKHGFSYPKALKIAAQTFAGAARLILKGGQPEVLLQQIAPPNGMTEAGLRMMTSLEMDENLGRVIETSAKRSQEMSLE